MDGHNVVELHSFTLCPLQRPPHATRHVPDRPCNHTHRTVPPCHSVSTSLLAPIPPRHHTIYTPPTNYHNVALTLTVNRLRVFPLTNLHVYGTITQDTAIPFSQATT